MPEPTTPMLRQYMEIKEKCKDAILFFRLGDFYEMFMEDAEIASRILEITLTSREAGRDKRVPMCGVPYHAVNSYLLKLLQAGYKVAICEQIEDPASAKGIVKRDIIKIISPGTITDPEMLDSIKNNYLACIYIAKQGIGFAYADISTGEFKTTSFNSSKALQSLRDELSRIMPVECIKPAGNDHISEYQSFMADFFRIRLEEVPVEYFAYPRAYSILTRHFHTNSLHPFGCEGDILAVAAAGALFYYIKSNDKSDLSHFTSLSRYNDADYMVLDLNTRRNLELTRSMRGEEKGKTLCSVLDHTLTSMGARLIRKWIEQPMINAEEINNRLDAVEELYGNYLLEEEIKPHLKKMYDLERILGKIHSSASNARDLLALCQSLSQILIIKEKMSNVKSSQLRCIAQGLDPIMPLMELLRSAIRDDPPPTINEGHMIREGFSPELDLLLQASREGKQWIAELEARERENTGIKSLKVGYNQVFGYYIEVTRANLSSVPSHYHRKQTLANAERYITDELKKLEDMVLGAQDKIVALERQIFHTLRQETLLHTKTIQSNAALAAMLDVYISLASVARKERYVRPVIDGKGIIQIKEGRHPVVEKAGLEGGFIPNDTFLNNDDYRLHIITGPNMAGKSTYMRQIALIVLMAQIGSFVPASEAKIGIVDRIFTRVGASDDLATGQSTFMVEMNELSFILRNASKNSLLILDEIGRGTSTFDGLSIAWAVIEYINEKIQAKTLFATHYHELTELEEKFYGIKNYNVAVEEAGEDIIFLRKIIPGGASESYGIEVARLAGIPEEVLFRAKKILVQLEEKNKLDTAKTFQSRQKSMPVQNQLNLFHSYSDDFLQELVNLNLITMSPLEALNFLHHWQQKAKNKALNNNGVIK